MAGICRWMDDDGLRMDLEKYVKQSMKRAEILEFVKRDHPDYPWSIATLDRRLRHFNISYIEYDTPLEKVYAAIQTELNGPGKLLGYRALNQKLRIQHAVKVPRHLVHNVLTDLDQDGLDRRNLRKKKKRARIDFASDGPLWMVSLDGHDKLCGYQNSTFPFGVYGCLDTFSRKLLYILITYSNSNPVTIGKKYLEFLYEAGILPNYLRIDKGTETGKMATIHAYLTDKLGVMEDATDSVLFGPSTSNKIERWWKELHERLEKYFKTQLYDLIKSKDYDPHDEVQRQLLFYVFKPVIQQECEQFADNWNCHRIRRQKIELPTGVPNHLFGFPERYGGKKCGTILTADRLKDVAELSGVLEAPPDITVHRLEQKCKQLIPYPEAIEPHRLKHMYCYLKQQYLSQ